jgi:hypothetical protein
MSNQHQRFIAVLVTLMAFLASLFSPGAMAQSQIEPTAQAICPPSAPRILRPLFQWNFNNRSINGLTVLSGAWAVMNGELYVPVGNQIDEIVSDFDVVGDVAASVKTAHVSGYTSTGLFVRYIDSQHYYEIAFDRAANSLQIPRGLAIYKITPQFNLLAGTVLPFDIQLNQSYVLRVEVIDSTFFVYVNDQLYLTATDIDQPYTQGKVGLFSYITEATFDDLIVYGQRQSATGR